MHIPDGYLSPATCATLYAASAPFWYIALQRVKRLLSSRLVPLISLFAAFSFVIMMFNLPLPGGTTGHAVGMGIAAIVLGPWASMLAISVALLIQAVFFGDGGITAFGANCFNMAIVGSLVAYWVYRAVAGRAAIGATRRVVAGALAGYVAINVAALLTAIEFGIQPALYTDASGAPLYAPYPLNIAIPAMMLGHLTIAGLAELLVTGGVVAYLQRSDPALLKLTAPNARGSEEGMQAVARRGGWAATRRLWIGLAALMILSPLGLLAAGSAWGEWGAADFASGQARREIQAASGNVAPPPSAPAGLDRLSSVWTAPIPDYAPPWMKSAAFGYILSAMVGIGLVILTFFLISWVARLLRGRDQPEAPTSAPGSGTA
ncbi:MAG: cobalt transporter CbiM [Kouleothrix sp.]|jgi:cobalt/nickel transport system permease protein|nr:cobalt transporter CbiM [Kouleothrix sp.]